MIDGPVQKPADEALVQAALKAYEFWVESQIDDLQSRIRELQERLRLEQQLFDDSRNTL